MVKAASAEEFSLGWHSLKLSIDCEDVASCVEPKGGHELSKDVYLAYKFSDFIKAKEINAFKDYLCGIYFIKLVLFYAVVTSFIILQEVYFNQATEEYKTMQTMAGIPY
jgi:hypothetical protein